jgi:heterodisulfide reductase subunit A-like polyferredoxin
VTVVATGAKEFEPDEYGYGDDDRVLTHLALEGEISEETERIKNCRSLVMIQCVGSRDEQDPTAAASAAGRRSRTPSSSKPRVRK